MAGFMNLNKESYRFAAKVPANTGWSETDTLRVAGDGTVERVRVRIYIGAQLDLKLRVWLRRKNGGKVDEPLIKFVKGMKDYIDGDDDDFSFEIGVPVYLDDEIVVEYKNDDPLNAYDFSVDVEIDYAGGAYRMPVYGALKGVGA
jgi:hypothetical protein